MGTNPLRRHLELTVRVSDEARNASVFDADREIDLASGEADLEPGSRLRKRDLDNEK